MKKPTSVALIISSLLLLSGQSAAHGATVKQFTTYYACAKGGERSQLSVLAHQCPKGYKVFSGRTLGADMRGDLLSNANLSNANLTGANFSHDILDGASFAGSTLKAANFSHSQLLQGKCVPSNKSKYCLNFTDANLTDANFANATFLGNSSGDLIFSTMFTMARANLSYANLSGASISVVNMAGAKLSTAYLANAQLRQVVGVPMLPAMWILADFNAIGPGGDDTNIGFDGDSNLNLSGLNLTHDRFYKISNVLFNESNLTDAVITDSYIGGENFSSANLTGVMGAGLTGIPAALPQGWELIHGYLVGPTANLKGADLGGADLEGLNLSGAQLIGANLVGANLTGVNLAGANWSNDGADNYYPNMDGTTICPNGQPYGSGGNC